MQESGIQSEAVDAIILCGGLSERMGQDKAWLAVGGEYFLHRLVSHLQPLVQRLVVVKAAGQDIPQLPSDAEIVDDEVREEGPLSGFVTGLKHLRKNESAAAPVWLASCDSPFFSESVFLNLLGRLDGCDAVAVDDGDFLHPFSAWYSAEAQQIAIQSFANGQRGLTKVLRDCDSQSVAAGELAQFDRELKFLKSVNTPEDLEWAERHWENTRNRP